VTRASHNSYSTRMTLAVLPNELINRICSYLEPCDLYSLRLSCNELLQKSQKFFGENYSKTIWMIVTSDSLRQLQEIAVHACFRTCVRQLTILPVLFEDDLPMLYSAISTSSLGSIHGHVIAWGSLNSNHDTNHTSLLWRTIKMPSTPCEKL